MTKPLFCRAALATTLSALTLLCGCQKTTSQYHQLVIGSQKSLLCDENLDEFNNQLYDFWLRNEEAPMASDFAAKLEDDLSTNPVWSEFSAEELLPISQATRDYYEFVANQLTASATTPSEKLELLAALEVGDHDFARNALQTAWSEQKNRLKSRLQAASLELPCQKIREQMAHLTPPSKIENPLNPSLKTTLPRAVEGLRWAFATAYQSCSVLDQPSLTEETPNVEGIEILKKGHPDGVGKRRVYGDLEKIIATHPYYKTNAYGSNCFDARRKPLIYDYGGKPYTSSANDSALDFFTDNGSGTSVLGIDCSGFIFSALARGGLKLAPNKPLKAVLVNGVSARMFKDPAKNGLSCFSPIPLSASSNLKAGDIIASQGHVIMIDQVGEDPLGLNRASHLADCTPETLNSEGFDFVIAHSTPWKEGVGINRSKVRDYLRESETFRNGLTSYAIALCQMRFKSKTTPKLTSDIRVVRHNATPSCLSLTPVPLRFESCVKECNLEDVANEVY